MGGAGGVGRGGAWQRAQADAEAVLAHALLEEDVLAGTRQPHLVRDLTGLRGIRTQSTQPMCGAWASSHNHRCRSGRFGDHGHITMGGEAREARATGPAARRLTDNVFLRCAADTRGSHDATTATTATAATTATPPRRHRPVARIRAETAGRTSRHADAPAAPPGRPQGGARGGAPARRRRGRAKRQPGPRRRQSSTWAGGEGRGFEPRVD